MTAAPVGTGADALGVGEALPDIPILGPAIPYQHVAEVRALCPDTITDDTDEFPSVTVEAVEDLLEPAPTTAITAEDSAEIDETASGSPESSEVGEPELATTVTTEPSPTAQTSGEPARPGWLTRQYQDLSDALARNRARRTDQLRQRSDRPTGGKAASTKGYWVKRSAIQVAYLMSIGFSGYGQTLFFAEWMGIAATSPSALLRAAIGAVFLELTMIGADGYSMYHRQKSPHQGWKALRLVGWLAAAAGAALNFSHFGHQAGVMFAAATISGFVLQDISGHLRVRTYLEETGRLRRKQKIGLARWIIHRSTAYAVWKRIVTDPDRDVDAEFRRMISDQNGARVLAEVETAKAATDKNEPGEPAASTSSRRKSELPKPAEVDLGGLVDGVFKAERDAGQRIGIRRIQTLFGYLTQSQARELRKLADQRS